MFYQIKTRHIFSVSKIDIDLIDLKDDKIDFTHSISRNVSPYHIEYLRNMGSGSTTSCSIRCNGTLWGLISIHYLDSRAPTIDEFIFLQNITKKFEDIINQNIELEKINIIQRFNKLNKQFTDELNKQADPLHTLLLSRYSASKITASQGMSIIIGNDICNTGIIPSIKFINQLCLDYLYLKELEIVLINQFDEKYSSFQKNNIAGCAIIRLSKENNSYIFIYRIETNMTVSWGGDPRHNLLAQEKYRYSPRNSFKKWVELVKGKCIKWNDINKKSIEIILKSMLDFFEVNPKELVLLVKNSIRQKIRKERESRNTVIEFIDNIQTSIAIGVENFNNKDSSILLNTCAIEAFSLFPSESRNISLNEFEKLTDIKISELSGNKEINKMIMTKNKGLRECKIKIGLIFEVVNKNYEYIYKIQVIEFYDITESKRIQDTLIATRDKALLNSKLRDELYAKLNHELRTPLSIVIGYSDILLMSSTLHEDDKNKLAIIRESASDLNSIINITLDNITSIETIDQNEFINIRLLHLIEHCILSVENKLVSKKIILEKNIPDNIESYSHPRGLKQIILNILVNAIKYNIENGKIKIDVYEDNKFVTIAITDTGIGMSEEQIEKCTIPFKRYSDESEGAGLGLSITNNLITLMGGIIKIKSEINKGTRVEILISNKKNKLGEEFKEI